MWLLLAACAKPVPAAKAPSTGLVGTASWYGAAFAGRPTASGVAFAPEALTAAHRSLPFGTRVTVTRIDTGAKVTVTVNDRGPYSGGRIIDVSEAAARQIDIIEQGVARVKLTVVGCDAAYPACR